MVLLQEHLVKRQTTTEQDGQGMVQTERQTLQDTLTPMQVIGRVAWAVLAIVVALLVLRLLLAAFGANLSSPFGRFVYDLSTPLVYPFAGLFGTVSATNASRFELDTMCAIIVYVLVGGLVSAIVRAH